MKPNRKVPIKPRDKTEYILSTLKKLQHKAEEQYVISRILHKLDDLSIEFVCQQYLVPDEDSYLLDLFFPQFQIFVEVNERGHASASGIYKDEKRNKKIQEKFGLLPIVIKTYGEDRQLLEISEINKQVDEFVDTLRTQKQNLMREGKFVPWDYDIKFNPEHHARHGVLKVEADVTLETQSDVLRMFGQSYKAWQKGAWDWKGTEFDVWFPKFFKSSAWVNKYAEDGTTIIEQKLDGGKAYDFTNKKRKRVVFPHFKDQFGNRYYKFVGVYEIDDANSGEYKIVHKLISKSINLQNPNSIF